MEQAVRKSFSPFPDRERRHLLQFYLAPKWNYGNRLSLAGGLILFGVVIQLFSAPEEISHVIITLVLSIPLIFTGVLFLLIRGYDSKPKGSLSSGEWEKTTLDRFQEVLKLEKKTSSWDETIVDLTCLTGFGCFLAIAGLVFWVSVVMLASSAARLWSFVFVADAVVLIIPLWITGTRSGWRPKTLRQQIEALQVALKVLDGYREPACQIQPMMEMAGKGDQKTPIGARVFIRFPDGPEDFYGIQFQVALNNVQGTHYPYLYAVIVAKKSFKLLSNHIDKITNSRPEKIIVEPSREKGVEVIVIRQKTSKTKGYHTKPHIIQNIVNYTWQSAAFILKMKSA